MDPELYKAAMEDKVGDLEQCSPDNLALQVTPTGNTLLHVAAQFDSWKCVRHILSKCDPSLLCRVNADGNTPIHVASARTSADAVHKLRNPPDGDAAVREMLRVRNHDGDTPLHSATRYDTRGTISYRLLWKDPEDFGPNNAGETPLYLMVERGNDMYDLDLMLRKCTPQEYGGPGGRTALHAAVTRRKGLPAVSSGPGSNSDQMLDKLIIWNKELIKEPDDFGRTPLHYAAENGDVEAITKLLKNDKSVAYVTAEKGEGNTALHVATAKGEVEAMKELLSSCPDCWEILNSKGRNILHISADMERDDATKYISEQKWAMDLVNRKDHEGNTPMHVLARKGKQKSIDMFTGAGADMKALNNEALTPYDILLPAQTCRQKLMQRTERRK